MSSLLVLEELSFCVCHDYFLLIICYFFSKLSFCNCMSFWYEVKNLTFAIKLFLSWEGYCLHCDHFLLHWWICFSKRSCCKTIKRAVFDGKYGRLVVFSYFCKHDHFEKIWLYGVKSLSLIPVSLFMGSNV